MGGKFKQGRDPAMERDLKIMGGLLLQEKVIEAYDFARQAGLGRHEYLPTVIERLEDLIVNNQLSYVAAIAYKFELTERDLGSLRPELTLSIREYILHLRESIPNKPLQEATGDYKAAYREIAWLARAFDIPWPEIAQLADSADRIFRERRRE